MPSWYIAGNERFQGPVFPAAGGSLLLDTLSATATIAYSTRKLRSAYAGSALQAGTAGNLGFTGGGDLNSSSLSGTDSINKWYDQSGNGYDAPLLDGNINHSYQLIVSGTLQTQNSHVWAAGQTNLSGLNPPTTGFTTQPWSLAFFGAFTGISGTQLIVDGASLNISKTSSWFMQEGTGLAGGTSDTSVHTFFYIFNGGSSSLIVDGTTVASGNAGTNFPSAGFAIGNFAGTVNIGELLFFNNTLLGSTDQSTIRSSWQTYWGAP